MNVTRLGRFISLVLLTLGVSVSAQEPTLSLDVGVKRPWGQGVPSDKQALSRGFFEKGNAQLKDSSFKDALESYGKALELWDHPAIHYNMVLTMALMGAQPLDIHRHLVAALRHGPEPLDPPKFQYAMDYKLRLEQDLAWVRISCDVPGAAVTMDGLPLFISPGHYEGLVRPGIHLISASKEGYETTDLNRTLVPGQKVTLPLKLYKEEELIRYRTLMPVWQPFAVLGLGAAVVGGGAYFHVQAQESYAAFDNKVKECRGCWPMEKGFDHLRVRGDELRRPVMGSYVAGGTALLAGAVLLILNRPQAYHIRPAEMGGADGSDAPGVSIGSNGAQVAF